MSRFDVERFEPPPDDEFLCCICQGVLDNPKEAPCRHVFCRVCIEKWLENADNKTCPTCRAAVTQGQLVSVLPILNNLINKLRPNCQNRQNGCQVNWLIETYDAEHETSCEYRTIGCKYEKCKTQVMARNVGKHEEKCDYRPYMCKKLCGLSIVAKDKSTHACVPLLKSTIEELKNQLDAAQEQVKCLSERNDHLQGLLNQPAGSSQDSEQSGPSWANFHTESDDEDQNSMSSIADFFMTSPSDQASPYDLPHQSDHSDHNAESSLTDSMVGFSESSENDEEEERPPSRPIMISSDSSSGYRTMRRTLNSPTNYSPTLSNRESLPNPASPSSRSDHSERSQQSLATDHYSSPQQNSPQSPGSVRSTDSRDYGERYSSVGSYHSDDDRRKRRRRISSSSTTSSNRAPSPKRHRGTDYSDDENNTSPAEVFATDSDDQSSDSADSTSESQYNN